MIEILGVSQQNQTALNAIVRLIALGVAQMSTIGLALFLFHSKKIEPEEKRGLDGNFWFKTYFLYSLLIIVNLISTLIISFILGGSNVTDVEPYSIFYPTLELLAVPLYIVLLFFVLTVGAAFSEELIFRRIAIPLLERGGYGSTWALLFSAVLFALMHTPTDLTSGSINFLLNHFLSTFTAGIFLGFLYIRTRKIRWPIGFHILMNGVTPVMQIGIIREEAYSDPTIALLGSLFALISIIIGGIILIIVIFQLIKNRYSPEPPIFIRILSDFSAPKTSIPAIFGIIFFLGVTLGIPLMIDFLFDQLMIVSKDIILIIYYFVVSLLSILVLFRNLPPLGASKHS